jgi:hypothetical protein
MHSCTHTHAHTHPHPPHTYPRPCARKLGGHSSSQRTPGGGHTGSESTAKTSPPPHRVIRAEGRERRAVKRPRDPPPPSCSDAEQAHVPFGAHSGAAWPRRNGMSITVSSTELWPRRGLICRRALAARPSHGRARQSVPSVRQLAHRPMQAFLYNMVLLLHTHTHTHTHTHARTHARTQQVAPMNPVFSGHWSPLILLGSFHLWPPRVGKICCSKHNELLDLSIVVLPFAQLYSGAFQSICVLARPGQRNHLGCETVHTPPKSNHRQMSLSLCSLSTLRPTLGLSRCLWGQWAIHTMLPHIFVDCESISPTQEATEICGF